MNMQHIIFIILVFLSGTSHSQVVVTLGGAGGLLSTNELEENSVSAQGIGTHFKIGMIRQSKVEVGIYLASSRYEAKVEHDSVENKLVFDTQSVGSYLTYYSGKAYFEAGYASATLKESLESSLGDSAQEVLSDIYHLKTNKDVTASEVRFMFGYKLFSGFGINFSGFAQKILMLDTSHNLTMVGLELKSQF